jgi:hypothetical protein
LYSNQPVNKKYETYNEGFYRPVFNFKEYLHKNTEGGEGNDVQAVEIFYQKQKRQ